MLRTAVSNALLTASTSGYTSVAMPAVGTGSLGFPADVVADIMFDTVINFRKQNPQSNIKEVRFVLYPADQDNIKVSY